MELQQFGWNAVTIGFLGTILFALVEGWGLWQQNKTIQKEKSGQSVSVIWFSYLAAMLGVVFIYGIAIKSIALIFNGLLLFLLHIPILRGLWKFKGFSRIEKVSGICFLCALFIMAIIPFKAWFFLLFSFGSIASFLMQPYEIWRNKNSGVVEIKLLAVYLASIFFWIIYAYAIQDWVLQIICPSYFVILALSIILWFKYRKKRKLKP